jgi:putative GTP pyrophosphokinase
MANANDAAQVINWDKFFLPYNQAVNELVIKLKSLSDGFSALSEPTPIEQVFGRVKSVTSILEKAKRKGIEPSGIEDEIEDIAGIRIICRFVDDIPRVVKMLRDRDGQDLLVVKERDYVEKMKASGYRSYHIHIRYPVITALGIKRITVEIQIRTLAMNFWGVTEHSLRYKHKGAIPAEISERLLRAAKAAEMLDSEISKIREEVLEAEHSELSRDKTVETIVKKLQVLYRVGEAEEIESLNREFHSAYESGSIERLEELDRVVQQVADYYKIW